MIVDGKRQLRLFPHLRFSPDILKRLGEELNPHPEHGLIELVRNAYDADARTCRIRLENVDEPSGRIVIEDDGVGMDESGIENHWLVLGQSSKAADQPTRLGRIPVGSKGLGRLAALRLGAVAELVSRPESEPTSEYHLRIDWDRYDLADLVEDVEFDIQHRKREKNTTHGTVITLAGLKHPLARADVTRLARGLLLLADPFTDNPTGFDPILESVEFRDLEFQVKQRYFRDAEYHLSAVLDAKGRASARVLDFKGQELFSASHDQLGRRGDSATYQCPAAEFDLWAFILDHETFSTRNATIKEVKTWLTQFGGVHLYVRGFRVAPYGDRGNDWLELDRSRVKSPEVRPSTNTSIGRMVVRDPGRVLQQKTDRSGLIEDEAFRELKRFATDALDWMATQRKHERDQRQAAERIASIDRVTQSKLNVETAIDQLPQPEQAPVKEAFERYEKAREREAEVWRKEVQLYRTLSTAGITAAVFAHESRKPIDLIQQTARQIERNAGRELGQRYAEMLERPVERIKQLAGSLQAFSAMTLSQIDNDKRRLSCVEIHAAMKRVATMFAPFMEQRKVEHSLSLATGKPFLRGSEAAIEAILTNLLTNSLRALEQAPPGCHRIDWQTSVSEGGLELRASDSGPGIQGIELKDIWLPGETTYAAGTGLGLAIVRDTVRDLGGTVDALAHGSLGGAEILIFLPILGD